MSITIKIQHVREALIILLMPIFLALPVASEPRSTAPSERQIVGWVEKVRVHPGNLVLHAKLEPGIPSSDIHAEEVKTFKKGGKRWVRFVIRDRYGKEQQFKKPVIRTIRVRAAGSKEIAERYVAELGMCFSDIYFEDEVSLSDRSKMEYELRLGRQSLEGIVLIDPAQIFTVNPKCKSPKPKILKDKPASEAAKPEDKE